jgi:hypothetical protein
MDHLHTFLAKSSRNKKEKLVKHIPRYQSFAMSDKMAVMSTPNHSLRLPFHLVFHSPLNCHTYDCPLPMLL